jgi:hypothetical protein
MNGRIHWGIHGRVDRGIDGRVHWRIDGWIHWRIHMRGIDGWVNGRINRRVHWRIHGRIHWRIHWRIDGRIHVRRVDGRIHMRRIDWRIHVRRRCRRVDRRIHVGRIDGWVHVRRVNRRVQWASPGRTVEVLSLGNGANEVANLISSCDDLLARGGLGTAVIVDDISGVCRCTTLAVATVGVANECTARAKIARTGSTQGGSEGTTARVGTDQIEADRVRITCYWCVRGFRDDGRGEGRATVNRDGSGNGALKDTKAVGGGHNLRSSHSESWTNNTPSSSIRSDTRAVQAIDSILIAYQCSASCESTGATIPEEEGSSISALGNSIAKLGNQ